MIAYNAKFPSADDYLGVMDALHRFGAGVDHGNAELIASAFHADAVVDFSPCGRRMGLDFPVMTGGPAIAGFLGGTAQSQTTTHVITNGRVHVDGDTATLQCLVDATHLPRDDHSRHCRMMNWYDVVLERDNARWRMRRVVINSAWFSGDPKILQGA